MASQQQQRRENATQEREVHVEKDIVPKLANRFEELAHAAEVAPVTTESATHTAADKGSTVVVMGAVGQTGGHGGAAGKQETTESGNKVEKGTHFESISDKVGGLEFGGGTTERRDREKEAYEQDAREARHGGQQQHQKPGWTEKGGVHGGQGREMASQQPKKGGEGGKIERETGGEGRGEARGGEREGKGGQQHQQEKNQTPSLEEISRYRQTAQQNSMDAIRAAEERYAQAKEKSWSAMQEAKEAAKHGVGAATTKASELGSQAQEKARDGVGATAHYLSENTVPVKETATEKAQQAKEALSSAGQKSKEYAAQKAEDLKTVTHRASEYTGEKAVQAKDTTKSVAGYVGEKAVETGKTAAEYAGKLAEEVKEQAVVAGWGAAHYTTEIAVEATKMAGGVVGKAKDVVASAAHKATELTEKPVVLARDTAVDAGERVADYTARKKIEAQRYKDEKSSHYQVEGEAKPQSGEGINEKGMNVMEGSDESTTMMDKGGETGKEKGGGVLGAIGETIVEIAQHTTELVAGPAPGSGAKVRAEEEHRES